MPAFVSFCGHYTIKLLKEKGFLSEKTLHFFFGKWYNVFNVLKIRRVAENEESLLAFLVCREHVMPLRQLLDAFFGNLLHPVCLPGSH